MHQYIVDTLTSLGIEMAWGCYTGDADHYLIFSVYQEEETDRCDDQYLFDRFYLTISFIIIGFNICPNGFKMIQLRRC